MSLICVGMERRRRTSKRDKRACVHVWRASHSGRWASKKIAELLFTFTKVDRVHEVGLGFCDQRIFSTLKQVCRSWNETVGLRVTRLSNLARARPDFLGREWFFDECDFAERFRATDKNAIRELIIDTSWCPRLAGIDPRLCKNLRRVYVDIKEKHRLPDLPSWVEAFSHNDLDMFSVLRHNCFGEAGTVYAEDLVAFRSLVTHATLLCDWNWMPTLSLGTCEYPHLTCVTITGYVLPDLVAFLDQLPSLGTLSFMNVYVLKHKKLGLDHLVSTMCVFSWVFTAAFIAKQDAIILTENIFDTEEDRLNQKSRCAMWAAKRQRVFDLASGYQHHPGWDFPQEAKH